MLEVETTRRPRHGDGVTQQPAALTPGAPTEAAPAAGAALLGAVARAAEVLAGSSAFVPALAEAARVLGEATGVDRLNVFRYDHDAAAGFLVAQWSRAGIAPLGPGQRGPYAYHDYEEVWRPTMAGDAYHSSLREKTGANAELNAATGTRSDLHVPVFVDGRFWGLLNFDDCTTERTWADGEIEVLRTAAAAVAAAVRRDLLERSRAEAAEARAADAESLNRLLTGVVAASRALLDAPDLETGLRGWLAHLALAMRADRAGIGLFAPDPSHALPLPVTQLDWSIPGVAPHPTPSPIPRTRDFDAWTTRLLAGEWVWATRDDLADPASRAYWDGIDCAANLIVPVHVGDAPWGWLYLDYRTARACRADDVAVLRTAADGVASAVRREQALRAAESERRARELAEQAHAAERERLAEARLAELARRNALLSTAIDASRGLIDASDFDLACDQLLAALGRALDVDRAALGILGEAADGGLPWCELTHEWTAAGIPRQMDDPALRRTRLAGTDAMRAAFEAGLPIQTRVDDLPEPQRSEQAAAGARAAFALPVVIGGRPWGVLGFDDCRRARHWDDEEIGFLQIVASALAAAVQRNAAEAARAEAVARERERAAMALAEERRAAAERHATELAAANDVLRTTVATLASGRGGVSAFVDSVLHEAARVAGAAACAVVLHDAERDTLRVTAVWADGGVLDIATAPWLAGLRAPVPADAASVWSELLGPPAPLLVRPFEAHRRPDAWAAAHRARGHATLGYLKLQVGARALGFLGLAWHEPVPVRTPERDALLTALAQQLSLALELDRLAAAERAEAAQAAVLEERTRVARELHDTIAQGVAGVVMQLRRARAKLGASAAVAAAELDVMERLARDSLAEARHALVMLRPAALQSAGLAAALERLVEGVRATEASSHASVEYRGDGAPRPLPAEVEMELLRIGQAALANACRHARATRILVDVTFEDDGGVRLAVTDDGCGFDPGSRPAGRFGLTGMSERAARIGATLSIVTAPGEGTEIVARWVP